MSAAHVPSHASPVLVAVDPFDDTPQALRWAVAEARSRAVALHVLSVYDTQLGALADGKRVVPPNALHELVIDAQREMLDAVEHDGVEVTTLIEEGRVVDVAMELAADAALLVVGTRGLAHGIGIFVGAVGHALISRAPVPVAVVPDVEPEPLVGVVVGSDGTVGGDDALRWGVDAARRHAVPLEAVAAVELHPVVLDVLVAADGVAPASRPEARRHAHRMLQKAMGRIPHEGVDVVLHAIEGRPDRVLREQGEHAGLVVVGRRGLGALGTMLLGSTGHRLLRKPPCTVVVVPPATEGDDGRPGDDDGRS